MQPLVGKLSHLSVLPECVSVTSLIPMTKGLTVTNFKKEGFILVHSFEGM